jgi:hypothetical protein
VTFIIVAVVPYYNGMKLVATLILVFLQGCSFEASGHIEGRVCATDEGCSKPSEDSSAAALDAPKPKTYRALLDDAFSDAQQADIVDALDDWHTAAGAPSFSVEVHPHAEMVRLAATTEHDGYTALFVLGTDTECQSEGQVHGDAIAFQYGALICYRSARISDTRWMWQATARHELGHFFGLEHNQDSNVCVMDPIPQPSRVKVTECDAYYYRKIHE